MDMENPSHPEGYGSYMMGSNLVKFLLQYSGKLLHMPKICLLHRHFGIESVPDPSSFTIYHFPDSGHHSRFSTTP